ncbi:PRELI-like family-domain-containing protein [Jimgerdemannia flammicorona]|uniref:PRELI-like family-domain-containing protein n=1 Tax=Jimgerdemannia flammicorona TaxID=994334 RepID=A0A433Q3J1_9FUNG|nr:PRELI-like family-domain-containing protein [Jimgerdemannia flammicorona]
MKLFQFVHQYNYPWSQVSAANWQKYPNEKCPHVLHVDVLNRAVDPVTGVLTTERLIAVQQNAPAIIMKLIGGSSTQFVREISVIDPRQKKLTMKSINLTMSHLISCEETVTYQEDPTDASRTVFTQSAAITAGSTLSRMANYIEDVSVKRFQQNAAVGRQGFQMVLERFAVMAEGSTSASSDTA